MIGHVGDDVTDEILPNPMIIHISNLEVMNY